MSETSEQVRAAFGIPEDVACRSYLSDTDTGGDPAMYSHDCIVCGEFFFGGKGRLSCADCSGDGDDD